MADTDSSESTQTCTQCGQEKPLTGFHKRYGKYAWQYKTQCRLCANIKRRKTHARKTPEAKAHTAQVMKTWRQKNQALLTQFEQDRREHQNVLARLRHARNPAKKRAAQKVWRLANTKKLRANSKAWRLANKEQHKANHKAWKQNNRDKVIVLHAKRRARQHALPATFTNEQAQFARQYFHYACAACGNEEGFQWVIGFDHWIPVVASDCPGTVATNMIPLCHGLGGCNNTKHDKAPKIWLTEHFSAHKATQILKRINAYFALVRSRDAAAD